MKKVLPCLAVLALVAMLFASCATSGDCPAYGKHGSTEFHGEKRF